MSFRHIFQLCFLLLTFVPSVYYLLEYFEDQQAAQEYLVKNGLNELAVSRQTAIEVSQAIRRDFNVDEASFKVLDPDNRPFLRHDTDFLLTNREGTCGQGTRVLVNLLSELGFDATRVTLYDRYLSPSHTLVSVRIDDATFLLDSINTRPWFNEFLIGNRVDVDAFPLISYTGSEKQRERQLREYQRQDYEGDWARFFTRFWIYSYEGTPYTKVLTRLGFGLQVFQLERPGRLVSILSENPNLVMVIVMLVFALSCNVCFLILTGSSRSTSKHIGVVE